MESAGPLLLGFNSNPLTVNSRVAVRSDHVASGDGPSSEARGKRLQQCRVKFAEDSAPVGRCITANEPADAMDSKSISIWQRPAACQR
jgi:hypothetical protein